MKRLLFVSVGMFVLSTPARALTPEAKKATSAYLQKLQIPGGGFAAKQPTPASGQQETPSLRATSSGLRALKYFGGEVPDKAACAKFVAGCFDKETGGFRDNPKQDHPDVFSTAVGIMAVVELKMPVDDFSPAVVKFLGEKAKAFEDIRIAVAGLEAIGKKPEQAGDWIAAVHKLRNSDGSFGKGKGTARATGGSVVTLLRLGDSVKNQDKILEWLRAGQRKDGGFGKEDSGGSDLETTYRVMRAFHMLKAKPESVDRLKEFIGKCRNRDGGYGISPGQPSGVGPTYFAAIVQHWLEEN